MLPCGTDAGGLDVPMVHPCARPECETLTLGTLCLEHEQEEAAGSLRLRVRQLLPRLTTASVVVAAAVAGALIRSRLPR
jgi:hypothetical protein